MSLESKEIFQWNTPADEFADDVGSDEEILLKNDSMSLQINESSYIKIRTQKDEGIVINLEREEAKKFSLGDKVPEDDDSKKEKKKTTYKRKFPCPKCNKIWNWPWELRRHVLTHFKEKERQNTSAFKCKECGKGFLWKRDLTQHMRLHTGEKLLICSICEKKFTTRQALLHHVVVHTGEKPFQCAICCNRFTQPANLRTHMKKKHNDVYIKGNKCPHCNESFQSIVSVHQHILEDHQKIVAEEKEALELQRLLKEKAKSQKEEARNEARKRRAARASLLNKPNKNLKEWEIEYEFSLGDGLVKGVDWDRTPSNGELGCEECSRTFGWRYEAMFHGLCHLVDEDGKAKNKVCPECDTAFKISIGLKHHLVIHTGETPFLCLHCWKAFGSHIDLKLHIRKEHLTHFENNKSTEEEGVVSLRGKKTLGNNGSSAGSSRHNNKTNSTILTTTRSHESHNESLEDVDEEYHHIHHHHHDDEEESNTIVLSREDEEMTSNDDMIVIVHSNDFNENESSLIVMDPSSLTQMSNSVVMSSSNSQFINIDNMTNETTVVLSQDGGQNSYIVVQGQPDTYQLTESEESEEQIVIQ